MKRPPLYQIGAVVIGVGILCTLGTWQMQRLHWKNDIIVALEKDYAALEANRASLIPPARLQELSKEEQPLAIGKLRGSFIREDAILLGPRTESGRAGYHLLMPMRLDEKIILINTGWVDAIWKDDLAGRLVFIPQEQVTVTGVLRKPDWSSFASKNSPANDAWFRADVEEIAQVKDLENVYPFILYANGTTPPLHDVTPIDQHWLPRNKHLQYALFWYAMALTLLIVFGFYWRSYDVLARDIGTNKINQT
jgi:surfeit locus 1 family protein